MRTHGCDTQFYKNISLIANITKKVKQMLRIISKYSMGFPSEHIFYCIISPLLYIYNCIHKWLENKTSYIGFQVLVLFLSNGISTFPTCFPSKRCFSNNWSITHAWLKLFSVSCMLRFTVVSKRPRKNISLAFLIQQACLYRWTLNVSNL